MSQKERARVLAEFAERPKFTVLFLSLRAGGVGLNLTCAKRVFMMDPWWSFAVEAQAIDRVHRMGQTEEVHVTRFVVEGSIEEKMLKVSWKLLLYTMFVPFIPRTLLLTLTFSIRCKTARSSSRLPSA
jgi:SNF2 family DNA or RNA helicase